jgi:heme/copper-type cytochrome/quinol oxidase subunit 2
VTVKVTGYQWYWGYDLSRSGYSEVVSNMLQEQSRKGERFRTDNGDSPRTA